MAFGEFLFFGSKNLAQKKARLGYGDSEVVAAKNSQTKPFCEYFGDIAK